MTKKKEPEHNEAPLTKEEIEAQAKKARDHSENGGTK